MGAFLIFVGVITVLLLVYFNAVATIIVFKAPGSAILLNIIRSIFIWLIPIIGFAMFLRFTQQSFDCELHYKLIPNFIRNWIYDERLQPANPNADRNDRMAVRLGMSEMNQKFRDKY